MEKSSSARRMTGTEELLRVMSNLESNPDATKSQKPPQKARWQQIFMACFCIFTIAAAGKGFLYFDTEISAVRSAVESTVKDINTLKTQISITGTKEQLAAVTAEVDDLKTTNTQLRAEMREMREAFEALKTRKNTVVSTQRKRR
jgi:FtsZ-binding cell division protein ZapB